MVVIFLYKNNYETKIFQNYACMYAEVAQPVCILRTNMKKYLAWWHTHRKQFHSNEVMETLCQCSLCSLDSLFVPFYTEIEYV